MCVLMWLTWGDGGGWTASKAAAQACNRSTSAAEKLLSLSPTPSQLGCILCLHSRFCCCCCWRTWEKMGVRGHKGVRSMRVID